MTQGNRRVRAAAAHQMLCAPIRSASAVTLLELLVALGVIALLLAILLPALRGARQTANETIDLANLRSTHQQFYQWGSEHDDYFLNAGPPPAGVDFSIQYGDCTIVGPYMSQTTHWPLPLASWLGHGSSTWHPTNETMQSPYTDACGLPEGQYIKPTSYLYSRSMLADPQLWNPANCGETLDAARFYRRIRWSEVAHPSEKGLMHYKSAEPQSETTATALAAVLFVDGGAQQMDFNRSAVEAVPGCRFEPVVRTPLGVLGKDFHR